MHLYRTIHPRLKAVVLPLATALRIAVAFALAAATPAGANWWSFLDAYNR